MGTAHNYKFYMQECSAAGVPVEGTLKDLEADFEGLRYSKCEGLNAFKGVKNVYTEEYPEADDLRTYVPVETKRSASEIKFTLYFFGDHATRAASFSSFMDYISNGYHLYWDTARNRKFMFIPPTSDVSPSDEMWYAGTPYFKIELTLQNVKGYTESV